MRGGRRCGSEGSVLRAGRPPARTRAPRCSGLAALGSGPAAGPGTPRPGRPRALRIAGAGVCARSLAAGDRSAAAAAAAGPRRPRRDRGASRARRAPTAASAPPGRPTDRDGVGYPAPMALPLLLLAACVDYGFLGPPKVTLPDIAVSPATLDWRAACNTEPADLTVTNEGDAPLTLTTVTVEGGVDVAATPRPLRGPVRARRRPVARRAIHAPGRGVDRSADFRSVGESTDRPITPPGRHGTGTPPRAAWPPCSRGPPPPASWSRRSPASRARPRRGRAPRRRSARWRSRPG